MRGGADEARDRHDEQARRERRHRHRDEQGEQARDDDAAARHTSRQHDERDGGDADTDRVPGHEASDGGVALAEVARHVGHRADGVHLGGEEHEQACGEQEQARRA